MAHPRAVQCKAGNQNLARYRALGIPLHQSAQSHQVSQLAMQCGSLGRIHTASPHYQREVRLDMWLICELITASFLAQKASQQLFMLTWK